MVGRHRRLSRPACIDDVRQLVGHVDAEGIVPAVVEPVLELARGVLFEHVDVEFALPGEPREREVAAAHVADERHDRVVAPQQVELGVQGMAKEEFDHDLARPQLHGKPAERPLVLIARGAGRELLAQLLGEVDMQAVSGRVVDAGRIAGQVQRLAERLAQFLVGLRLHPDQNAARSLVVRPAIDVRRDVSPATEVEVADAEVGARGRVERFAQRGQQPRPWREVVKNARQVVSLKFARLSSGAPFLGTV